METTPGCFTWDGILTRDGMAAQHAHCIPWFEMAKSGVSDTARTNGADAGDFYTGRDGGARRALWIFRSRGEDWGLLLCET